PRSHYLSNQDIENPKYPASHHGFDSRYKMLNFRKLENIPGNPEPNQNGHITGLRTNAKFIQVPPSGDMIGSKDLVELFLNTLDQNESRFFEIERRIRDERVDILKQATRPRVIV